MRVVCAIGVLGMLTAGCGGEEVEPPPTGTMAYEVTHYDYRFDLETREAAVELTLEVVEGGDCLEVPMRTGGLRAVTLGGEPAVSGDLADGVLTVCGAQGWFAGETIALAGETTVPMETWDDSQVGYSVSTDVEDRPFHYLVSWVGGCDRFGPCDDRPDAFATYSFTVTHPSGTEVLCPGVVTPGDTETRCVFEHGGGPTYSTFGIAASPSWEASSLGTWDGVEVTLYDMPSSGVAAEIAPEVHEGFLAFMVEHFGPYPYGDELRLVVGPTFWNGFEHPGNILLYDGLPGANSAYTHALTHTTNHEIAHMWAGDQTTLADTYDFVWKEAMAEYLTFVYEDEQLADGYGTTTARAWKSFSRFAAFYPVPGERPPLLEYYGDVYGPGPMILFRQLEALFSRDAVMQALESLLGDERAIGVADVQAALEGTTGADLQNYFDTWVYGEGDPVWPSFTVDWTDLGGGSVEVTLAQAPDVEGTWGCAFAIELTGEAEGDRHEVWFDLGPDGTREATVVADDVPFEVTGFRFDPDAHCLARLESNGVANPVGNANPWLAR